ncbi:hypothetical protein K438DRAFT_1991536 [Mycena galopus ATCC 62051]|nr:hypothetical protein K438DRAFT_1991536 [Mycena galopus ATCC 62051]
MPKRIPTPEPGDDEPKYFTVVQPYPLNANWELPHDYITCGRWIAGCIGPAPFFAIFYKPSARGQIILEVNRDYPQPERLLGEHRWSEFLKKPNAEEAGRVSQIFYCTYSTGRQAQKDGWKRINVADSWFKNWNPVNPVIMNPYPPTVWCPLPPEDKTNKPMCRPLPVAVKAPPAPKAAPAPVVPGSATWVSQKSAPPTNTPAAMRGAWAAKQGTAADGNNAKKPNAKNNGGGGKKAIPANSAAPCKCGFGSFLSLPFISLISLARGLATLSSSVISCAVSMLVVPVGADDPIVAFMACVLCLASYFLSFISALATHLDLAA